MRYQGRLIKILPFSDRDKLTTLIENRRAYTSDNLELNVYETYQISERVPLKFQDMVLISMLKGKKVMHLNNVQAFEYLPGETIVLPAYADMKIDFPEATWEQPTQCTALTIRQEQIDAVIKYLNDFYPKHQMIGEWGFDMDIFRLYNTPELAECVNKLFQIMLGTNPLKDVMADLALKELIVKLMQSQSLLALDISTDQNKTVLGYIKDYVQKHLSEAISIEVLEKKTNMSRSSLFRMFKQELGISPLEYVIRERLKRAKDVLHKTKSVKEACFSAGFNDVNYFIRVFKKREGITPGMFIAAS